MAKAPLLPRRRPRTPSRTERVVGGSVLVLVGVVFALFFLAGSRPGPLAGAGEPSPEAAPASSMFLAASPTGWPRKSVEHYTEDTLFEKINGKADAYLSYGFEALHFAGYEDDAAGTYVDIYVYEMRTPLDAFGVYRAARTGTEEAFEVGAEGVQRDEALFSRKGPYLLEVFASDEKARDEAKALLLDLAARLESEAPPVEVPEGLEGEGVKLVQFQRRSALGVEGLDDAFIALHEDGTQAVRATFADEATAAAAAARVREDLEFLGQTFTVEQDGPALHIVVGKGAER